MSQRRYWMILGLEFRLHFLTAVVSPVPLNISTSTASYFARADIRNYHNWVEIYSLLVSEAGSLNGWRFILSWFQRLEAWNEGVSRAGSFWRLPRRVHCTPLCLLRAAANNPAHSLACRHIPPVSASLSTWNSVCASTSLPLLLQGRQSLSLGPTLI